MIARKLIALGFILLMASVFVRITYFFSEHEVDTSSPQVFSLGKEALSITGRIAEELTHRNLSVNATSD